MIGTPMNGITNFQLIGISVEVSNARKTKLLALKNGQGRMNASLTY
jgi:hypothetical protein